MLADPADQAAIFPDVAGKGNRPKESGIGRKATARENRIAG
jgi:hypothetical protein